MPDKYATILDINGDAILRVTSFKFLGTFIPETLIYTNVKIKSPTTVTLFNNACMFLYFFGNGSQSGKI